MVVGCWYIARFLALYCMSSSGSEFGVPPSLPKASIPTSFPQKCAVLHRQGCSGSLNLVDQGVFMSCASCGSSHQAEFTSEVNIHFRGLAHIDEVGVLIFPQLSVCLDCGFSMFTTSKTELSRLTCGSLASDMSTRNGKRSRSESVAGDRA
jgi:hypothetical protein